MGWRSGRLGKLSLVGLGLAVLLLLGFALWCFSLVFSVKAQRSAVEERVTWLQSIQQCQASAEPAGASRYQPSLKKSLVELEDLRPRLRPTLSAELARDLEAHSRAVRAKLDAAGGPSEAELAALRGTLHDLVSQIRKQTGALSASLGEEWDSLNYLVFAALGFAASTLVLLIVARRRNQRLGELSSHLERELFAKQQTLQALRNSERRYELAAEGSHDGIWDWDLTEGRISYSPGWAAMLGVLGAYDTPSAWRERIHPEDRQRVEADRQAHLEGKTPLFESEHRVRRREGDYLWVLTRGKALFDEGKKPLRIAGSQTDITRRRALAVVEQTTALLEHATDALGIGVVMLLPGDKVSYMSASLQALSQEWQGPEAFWEALRASCALPAFTACSRCSGPIRIGRAEARLQTPKGEPCAFTLVFTGHGHDVGREQEEILFLQDLTELDRLQVQLHQAERLASLGLLTAGLAHEINNPLTYMLLNLIDLKDTLPGLLRDPNQEEGAQVLESIQEVLVGAQRLQQIVRDVRLFSRPNDETVPVDVNRVLDAALNVASPQIKKRAKLVQELSPNLPPVLANESRLCQSFLNLLLNAVQAIPEEEPRKHEISLKTSLQGASVLIEISDTGIGIEPKNLTRIFDPFFTTKPVGLGTGLGLSICHRLVTSLGGQISVRSTPGKGSSFSVLLPWVEPPKESAPEEQDPQEKPLRARILALDDEIPILTILKRILVEHDVTVSYRGADAMDKARQEPPFDIIFCDLNMPEQNGEEFFLELLGQRPDYEGKIFFMSGGGFVPKSPRFIAYLKEHSIEKPLDLKGLRTLIQTTMKKAQAMTRPQASSQPS